MKALPQLIYLGFILLELGIVAGKHGEYRKDKYSFGASLFCAALSISLLYWGGFFDCLF